MGLKVSVAMCTYNGRLYLEEQLKSIAAQSRVPDELVVCDDGSQDGTMDILKVFKKNSPFPVRIYVNEKNMGSTKNFEKALSLCGGDIIAFSDQDDVWRPEKLEKILKVFSSAPSVGLVFTDAEVVDKELKPLDYSMWDTVNFTEKDKKNVINGKAVYTLLRRNVATGATMAFRSCYRDAFLPIPENWYHDAWVAFIISVLTGIGFIDEQLIKYRQHSGQQIGGARNSGFKWDEALRDNSKYYESELDHYDTAYKRLIEIKAKLPHGNKTVRIVEDRLNYLYWRSHLPGQRLKRLPGIFKNIFQLQYHRYSNGFVSALKDLLLN